MNTTPSPAPAAKPAHGTPTQVAHPWRATLRTGVAVLAVLVPSLIAAIPIINAELGAYLPDAWEAALIAAGAFLVALSGLVTRLMALPGVQAGLAALGLGTGVERERGAGVRGRRADRDGTPDGRDTPPAIG